MARNPRIFRPSRATGPDRYANTDTYRYFGDPVYTYALKEGIGDGFLTPFKVRQMASTMDTYTLADDDEVLSGDIDRDREYTEADFNTKLVINEREKSRVQEFMDQIDQRQKTLVFCATQDHAVRVRNFINQIKDNPDPHYCERVKAYEHFNDPEWDGEPLPPDGPAGPDQPGPTSPEPPGEPDDPADPKEPTEKIIVKLADGKERKIRYVAATTYMFNGRPITAQEFMDHLFGDLGTLVTDEGDLRAIWSDPVRRTGFLQRLTEMGYDSERMDDMRRLIDAPNSDVFDVLAYIRFTLAPLARSERVQAAKAAGMNGYEEEMREFLSYVLQSYEMQGVRELELSKISDFLSIRYGGTNDAKRELGSVAEIRGAFIDIQRHLFQQDGTGQ